MAFVTEDAVPNCSNLLEDGELSTMSNQTDSGTIDPTINFLFRGIGILLLAFFGITANLLSVVVLSHPKLKSSLTTLLVGLTISDVFVVGSSFLIFSVSLVLRQFSIFSSYATYIRPHLLPWLIPINYTAQMSSLYFTVIITLERYIAVCLPFQSRSLCTRSAAQKSALIVVLVTILYNVPRWFEYQTVPESNCEGPVIYKATRTEFRLRDDYTMYYVNWCYIVVINVVPFTVLLYFNIAIYLVAQKHRSQRNSLSPTMESKQNEDMQLAGMLFGIVITFFVCAMLDPVIIVMTTFGIGETRTLIPIRSFLLVFNSSTNFVFYCWFGTEFRRRLKQVLRITPSDDKRKSTSPCVSYVVSTSIDFSNSVTTLGCEQHQEKATSLPNSSTRF